LQGTKEMTDISQSTTITEAIELMRALRQHEAGGCDAANTVFAVFGIASPQGRRVDKFSFLNPPYVMWLEDLAYDHGAGDQIPRARETIKSDAAQAMGEHKLSRSGSGRARRKVAMTDAARNALLDYYREKIELIGKVHDLLDGYDAMYPYRKSYIRKHYKACEQLCRSVEDAP
jgi:hypothetical protein